MKAPPLLRAVSAADRAEVGVALPPSTIGIPLKVLTPSDQQWLWNLPYSDRLLDAWAAIVDLGPDGIADLGRVDRFYLLSTLLHRPDVMHPWLYDRCREVERQPDGCLDLWAREHYKSTIVTFAGSIQELLKNPELTIGVFSHTKPTAKKFVLQVMQELEANRDLQRAYPDVLWSNPRREAPEWSEDKGITVKRKSNPREASLEAHGLVDGQPTGSHFGLRIYDDVVTLESVTTPEQVKKTTEALAVSDNLGARGADGMKREQFVGTRYKFSDTYQDLLDRKAVTPRIYPATHDGTPTGKPVFLSQEALNEIRRKQPTAIFAAQQLMNPSAGSEAMFSGGEKWLKFTDIRPSTLNVYIVCDPASSRKKGSDRTAMLALGLDAGRNKYLLGGYCHRMGLTERWNKLKGLYQYWKAMPGVQIVKVGYERFGMMDALEHFEERMLMEKVGFEIIELSWPKEGADSKFDRIQRLEPDYRAGKWWFAAVPTRTDDDGNVIQIEETRAQAQVRAAGQGYRVFTPTRQKDGEGNIYSLNKMLFDEYFVYPYAAHDDMLDCQNRIYDMDPSPPILLEQESIEPESFVDGA